jgi:hypothetical protein
MTARMITREIVGVRRVKQWVRDKVQEERLDVSASGKQEGRKAERRLIYNQRRNACTSAAALFVSYSVL